MLKTLRNVVLCATIAFACVGLAACANEKSTGNTDAKKVDNTTTTSVVATTEDKEKTEATTTTTTTAGDTTTEPDTNTTTADTTAEPETETTTTDTTKKVMSPNAVTTTTEVTEEPDNSDGMYTLEECFRRKVEEVSGQKVNSIEKDDLFMRATLENGEKAVLLAHKLSELDVNKDYSMDQFKALDQQIAKDYSITIQFSE